MSDWISIPEVTGYLLRIKKNISIGNFEFVERDKNVKSLARAGILPSQVPGEILALTYKDYFNGPEPERDRRHRPGELMFFGKDINGFEFLIKIKIENNDGFESCLCLSFHFPTSPITYPYKNR